MILIGYQVAMRNAAPGLRSRVKSKLDAHPIPINDLAAPRSPVRAPAKMPINPSQTHRKLIVTGVL